MNENEGTQFDKVENAQMEIYKLVKTDIYYRLPPEEKKFIPATVILAYAGILLSGFLIGYVKEAGERIGKATADKTFDLIESWAENREKRQKGEIKKEINSLVESLANNKEEQKNVNSIAVKVTINISNKLSNEQIKQSTKSATETVKNILVADDIPQENAANIAQKVCEIATGLIGDGHGT